MSMEWCCEGEARVGVVVERWLAWHRVHKSA
jgi:hypothetical protein